jgi:hypothetical protein
MREYQSSKHKLSEKPHHAISLISAFFWQPSWSTPHRPCCCNQERLVDQRRHLDEQDDIVEQPLRIILVCGATFIDYRFSIGLQL